VSGSAAFANHPFYAGQWELVRISRRFQHSSQGASRKRKTNVIAVRDDMIQLARFWRNN